MDIAYYYLALSGVLAALLWTPYIGSRLFEWGLPTFLNNYPESFPAKAPESPLWAKRAKRAHLNMLETLPAFAAVVVAAGFAGSSADFEQVSFWAQVFFFARVGHAVVYIAGIPYLRTPVYLVSWFAILAIGWTTLAWN